jgi:hypothetical protein
MQPFLLTTVRVAGLLVLAVSVWAVWQRRLTFGSRFDAAVTVAIALFGVGAALDAPWPETAAASYALTGRYYVLNVIGHVCYLAGGALIVRGIYLRLLPDADITALMRRWVVPWVGAAAVVMLGAFALSRGPSAFTADHLYLVAPDRWMTVCFVAHFGTTAALGAVAGYGVFWLRRDPRAVLLNVALTALMVAAVAGGLVVGWSVITGRIETLRLVAWLLTYVAFAVAMVASALQWRHRVRGLSGRARRPDAPPARGNVFPTNRAGSEDP